MKVQLLFEKHLNRRRKKKSFFLLGLLFLLGKTVVAQDTFYGYLKKNTLIMGNNRIERTFLWNNGNLITHTLTDKTNRYSWRNTSRTPDFQLNKELVEAEKASVDIVRVAQTTIHPAYLQIEVKFALRQLQVKRVYKVYNDCPAIACNTYLKGNVSILGKSEELNNADRKNIEFLEDMQIDQTASTLDKLNFKGQHWNVDCIEFFDATDWNNNLVVERNFLSYRKNHYRGNLLQVRENISKNGFFFLKEAPCSNVQLAYQGYDFMAEFGSFTVTGLGVSEKDITPDKWTPAYGCVIGVYGPEAVDKLVALRTYQKQIRRLLPQRDEMIMMNTWGDRSQDSKVNEAFCLRELERAAQLGITHFQIDDGWQTGKSPNSAVAKGSFKDIWSNPDYWTPDKSKYPRGLSPIIKRGKELGIDIALWFNPSIQDNFADWKKDAEAIIRLYKEYGICIFKIDGLSIPTKEAEMNLHRLFDYVLAETDNQVVFNLDATAGRRGGYHTFNRYGNIFLENRYTDWQNYYPYWTLRNLWQLSKYVPAEKLQIEFLNKWRNEEKYANDPFGPANYSFEYLFAITMAGQPLAWMEGTNLPQEALLLREQVEKYRGFQHDFHQGIILPVGDMPDGRSWTGFQSIREHQGYFIFFREYHPLQSYHVKTWLAPGTEIECVPLLGHGKAIKTIVDEKGTIEVFLPSMNDYVVYKYVIVQSQSQVEIK
ncbi:alpha-galactosidase [Bacteroides xylanisolvens]|uniref:Alpha-galactosidase n=1 Tax=Bacteroides xylanisolvens TaxID=371601 RepID=A0A415I1G2_9BACE|nr:alpha-galactosidase [Bacteroides xylanisolvens]RHL01462.1 alpha-galactosidase [Bacteroides xylanisolvens]